MLAVLIALSVIVALIAVNEVVAFARSPFGVVRAGACDDLLFDLEASQAALVEAVREEAQQRDPEAPHATASAPAGSPRSPLSDAAWAGGLAGAAGFADWWHVDDSVLGALAQWTHADIHNRLDLDTAIGAHDYKIDTHGFYIKLRGHVGEQDVYSQLHDWAGDRLYIPSTSNFPAADGALDGHMFNVKVGDSVAAIREHLRDHPDIPVIVNADMTGLPSDAAHVDLSHAFDPNILADHSIIVADGLSLSDIHDSMADALGPAMDGFDLHDAADSLGDLGVPVLGSAIRVVRSGIREHNLAAHHGDTGRMVGNIVTDVVYVGTGVMVGGVAAGLLIDVLTGGMTGGLGTTVIGPMIGSALGAFFGNKAAAAERMKPLTEARQAATVATLKYDQTVKEATERANGRFEARRIGAQSELTALADDLSVAWARSSSAATRDMLDARRHLNDGAKDALAQARNEVRRPTGVFAHIRRHRWSQAADEPAGTPARLDALLAHRQGRTKARIIVDDFSRRRAVILASLAHAADDMTALALAGRLDAVRDIRELREDLGEEVREATGSALATLWESTNVVRAELVATGTKTPEWVDENFPPVPRPH